MLAEKSSAVGIARTLDKAPLTTLGLIKNLFGKLTGSGANGKSMCCGFNRQSVGIRPICVRKHLKTCLRVQKHATPGISAAVGLQSIYAPVTQSNQGQRSLRFHKTFQNLRFLPNGWRKVSRFATTREKLCTSCDIDTDSRWK